MAPRRVGLAATLAAAALWSAPLDAEAGRLTVHEATEATACAADIHYTGGTDVFANAGKQLAEGWKMIIEVAGHSSKYAATAVDMWTIYNNVMKIMDGQDKKRAASSFLITGELFTSMEALYEVDRVFSRQLGILTDGERWWKCSQYADYERPTLDFTGKGWFPGRTFMEDNAGEEECIAQLMNAMYFVRWGACSLETAAEKWTQTMAQQASNNSFWKTVLSFNERRTCSGPALSRSLLSESLKKAIVDPGDLDATCVKHDGAVGDCSGECARVSECAAVTLDHKRRTCCFLTGNITTRVRSKLVHAIDRRVGDSCMRLSSRERFLMLTPDGVASWLERHGFGVQSKRARTLHMAGIPGIVLSFLSVEMLEKWLSTVQHPLHNVKELRCRIEAELNNEPDVDCSQSEPTKPVQAPPAATKSATDKNSSWVVKFIRRSAPLDEVKVWAPPLFDILVAAMNAKKVAVILEKGQESFTPIVAIKAAAAISGILKFREITAFHRCERVRSYLQPVVDQIKSQGPDPAIQTAHVAAQLAKGV